MVRTRWIHARGPRRIQSPRITPAAQPDWYRLPAEDTLTALGSSRNGLTDAEAASRLAQFGPNRVETGRRDTAIAILARQLTSPLVYVLLAALAVTLSISEWNDSIAIGLVLALNTVVGFVQEFRAENSVRALLQFAAPKAVVMREGWAREAPGEDVVQGDIILLEAGMRIPADARIIESSSVRVDESLLTGESSPQNKLIEPIDLDGPVPMGDRRNMAFMGATVTGGRGFAVVTATGMATELGAIAAGLSETRRVSVPLEQRIAKFARFLVVAVVVASVITFVAGIISGERATDMFLTTVALAVSAIPEGLPVVVTIALAVGVRRMARRGAIVRRPVAVETLGSCTVIVSDKTGTLTENRMTVQEVFAGGQRYTVTGPGDTFDGALTPLDGPDAKNPDEIAAPLRETLRAAVLTSEARVRRTDDGIATHGDPTEIALLVAAAKAGVTAESLAPESQQVAFVPFDSTSLYSATVHSVGDQSVVYVKGSPERILAASDRWLTADGVSQLDRDRIEETLSEMTRRGLRVIACATATGSKSAQTVETGQLSDLLFTGLMGMHDPPRPAARQAIAACRGAGIRVLMVTGDHAHTAVAVARELGLDRRREVPVFSGSDLEAMPDDELMRALADTRVFARVSPTQKLRIVQLLEHSGEVVGVTGDGVNDAPALKAAHLGLAMGATGTDVAREASEIVLVDDNFANVYAAVEEGRTAFANIRNASYFLIASGVGEVLAVLASVVSQLPLPLLPAQLLWLNVVTNGTQDVALAAEPGEPQQYTKPPRPVSEGILSRRLLRRVAIVGAVMAATAVGVFLWQRSRGVSLVEVRTATLTTLVLCEAFLVWSSRSEETFFFHKNIFSNLFLFAGVIVALGLHFGALYWSFTQTVLGLTPLPWATWLVITGLSTLPALAAELDKFTVSINRNKQAGQTAAPATAFVTSEDRS